MNGPDDDDKSGFCLADAEAAIAGDNTESLASLLSRNKSNNAVTPEMHQETCNKLLHCALSAGKQTCVSILLDCGADVNALAPQSRRKVYPLLSAIASPVPANSECLKLLLETGKIEQSQLDGALIAAAKYGRTDYLGTPLSPPLPEGLE